MKIRICVSTFAGTLKKKSAINLIYSGLII